MKLSNLLDQINKDFAYKNAKSLFKKIYVYKTSASFRLVLNYRIGRYLTLNSNVLTKYLAKRYKYKQITKRACQISYKCILGNNVKFPHPIGIVIGDGVLIGDNTMIWQHVTLGSHGKAGEELSYPKVGSRVRIYEGATVIGNVMIGDRAIIGSKSLVNKDVPGGATAYGIPAKVKGV